MEHYLTLKWLKCRYTYNVDNFRKRVFKLLITVIHCLYECVHVCHSTYVEVRVPFVEVCFLLPPREFWGLNSVLRFDSKHLHPLRILTDPNTMLSEKIRQIHKVTCNVTMLTWNVQNRQLTETKSRRVAAEAGAAENGKPCWWWLRWQNVVQLGTGCFRFAVHRLKDMNYGLCKGEHL